MTYLRRHRRLLLLIGGIVLLTAITDGLIWGMAVYGG